jgi:hypothetical protein
MVHAYGHDGVERGNHPADRRAVRSRREKNQPCIRQSCANIQDRRRGNDGVADRGIPEHAD